MNQLQRSFKSIKVLAGAAMLAPLMGCFENDHHRSRDRVIVEERTTVVRPPPDRVIVREPPPVVVESGTWYDNPRYNGGKFDRDDRDRHGRADKSVPRVAEQEAIGKGVIAWKSPARTYVWVTDSEHDAVMWSGLVFPGEVVEVVPRHNRIFVGHREVARFSNMKDEIRYRIWSDRGRLRL
jgi:hypothetical protein